MGIGIKKNVEVDATVLKQHLEAYSKIMGLGLAEVIRKQAGLFCMDLIKHTYPFTSAGKADTPESKAMGMKNIDVQVRKIFKPLEFASADEVGAIGSKSVFLKWEKARQEKFGDDPSKRVRWETFQARHAGGRSIPYIEESGQLKEIHAKVRKNKGRGGLQEWAKKAGKAFAIVKNEKVIEKYIKQKQKNVGILKSAYWFSSLKIKANVRAPSWTKHSEGEANAIGEDKTKTPKLPEVTVGNTIGRLALPESLMRLALNRRALSMRAEMAGKLTRDCGKLWVACAQGRAPDAKRFFT